MASVKKFLDNLTGADQERARAKKEAAALVQLANFKLDALESEMREKFRNRELESQVEIVGDRMGAFYREYRVNYSTGDLGSAVDDLLGQIMTIGSEKATAIISKALKNALRSMFTEVNVAEENRRLFVVLLEGVAMVRYDIWVWKSSEQDQALFKHAESVVAITYARSVVDHNKLTEDELNDGIAKSLGGVSTQEIIEYKKELLELFNLKANDGAAVRPTDGLQDGQLDGALMTMIKANADAATTQGAALLQRPATAPSAEVAELLSMNASEYTPR